MPSAPTTREDYIGGFPDHPHRGFETVTYMIAGRMRHRDSAGHEGLLSNGGVQWMTAGKGVIHSELPEQEDGRMEGFQLWLNLPAKDKLRAPWYRDIQSAELPEFTTPEGVVVRVIAGASQGVDGAVQREVTEPLYLDLSLPAGSSFAQTLPASHNAFVYVYRGGIDIGATHVPAQRMAILGNGADRDGVVLKADRPSRALLIAGKPLGRADRAIRPVRDEHAGRDHRGGAGLPGRQVRGLNAVQAPALPSSHPSPAAERGSGHDWSTPAWRSPVRERSACHFVATIPRWLSPFRACRCRFPGPQCSLRATDLCAAFDPGSTSFERGSAMSTSRNSHPTAAHPLRGHVYRDFARFAAEAFAVGLVVSLALALAIFIVSTQAQAADAGPLPGQGTLMLKGESATAAVAAPLLFTDVDIAVSGMTARTTVTQRFANPTSEWQEGVYVFPLPEKAAVDHLEMKIGQRRIAGQIRERGEARAAYEQAKTEGRKATLVEQERPNVFTTSVAHIGPGDEITVTIEYQETLRYDTGAFRLRFPMVVAPRYVPGTFAVDGESGSGWGTNTDQVPDAERITPPVAHPDSGFINPVTINVELQSRFRAVEDRQSLSPDRRQ